MIHGIQYAWEDGISNLYHRCAILLSFALKTSLYVADLRPAPGGLRSGSAIKGSLVVAL